MQNVNKYREVLLSEFYLDADDLTIRRAKDGWRNKYAKDDVVIPFRLCSFGYGGIHIPKSRTTIAYHHLLTLLRGFDLPDGCVIDHIDGNSENNVRSNIRITTQKINCRNRAKHKNNTSGFTGISWNKKASCYIVRKYVNGIREYGGSAKTLDEAKILFEKLNQAAFKDGYTERHGK